MLTFVYDGFTVLPGSNKIIVTGESVALSAIYKRLKTTGFNGMITKAGGQAKGGGTFTASYYMTSGSKLEAGYISHDCQLLKGFILVSDESFYGKPYPIAPPEHVNCNCEVQPLPDLDEENVSVYDSQWVKNRSTCRSGSVIRADK